jgi:hypothetical protein
MEYVLLFVIVPIVIGVLSNLISHFLTRWRDYKWQMRINIIRLRNVLYHVERRFSEVVEHHGTGAVYFIDAAKDDWDRWEDKCADIREDLTFTGQTFTFWITRWSRSWLYRRDIQTPEIQEHLANIGSVFGGQTPLHELRFYGIVECATDAVNLLRRTEDAHKDYTERAAKWDQNHDSMPQRLLNESEEALWLAVSRVVAHRKFVEALGKKIKFIDFSKWR